MQTPAPSTRRTSLGAVALSATLGAVAGFAIGGIIVPPGIQSDRRRPRRNLSGGTHLYA